MRNAEEHSPAKVPTHAASVLWLGGDDLQAAHGLFVRRGVTIVEPPDGEFMTVADPDGLLIEV